MRRINGAIVPVQKLLLMLSTFQRLINHFGINNMNHVDVSIRVAIKLFIFQKVFLG